MSQSVLSHPAITATKPEQKLVISEVRQDIPVPPRGGGSQLEPTLNSLHRTGLSVEVRGAPASTIRQWVTAYRKRRGMADNAFRVSDMGDHVAIWRVG